MPTFTIAPLTMERIDEAYPLVRMAHPELTAAAWQAEARARLRDGGIVVLLAPGGVIQALAGWTDQPGSPTLKIDLFVVFELSRRAPARQALRDGLQALAAGLGRQAVTFSLSSLGLLENAPAEAG